MSMINEELARRNHENHHMSDYKPGSETAEFNAVIAEANEKIEAAKKRVSPEHHERLDNLLRAYIVKYANWVNAQNSNGSSHVSWFISGPANYNMRKHERYMNRESKLWEDYDRIKNMIDHGISRIIRGAQIISSDNPDAVELLKQKIAKLEKNQEMMKAANKIVRSKSDMDQKIIDLVKLGFTEGQAKKLFTPDCFGNLGFAGFDLTNNNANIRRLKERLAALERKQQDKPTEREENGIRIVDNVDENRVQIFFPDKPSEAIRKYLKSNGFHWTPSIGCWQRMRSSWASEIASKVLTM